MQDLQSKHNETVIQRLDNHKPLESFALWRFAYHYIQMVSMKHNFRIRFVHTPYWGGQDSFARNDSRGLLGQLKGRQIDLAVNGLYIYQDRIAHIDHSVVVAMHG